MKGVFPHEDEEKGDWQVASWVVEQLESGLPEPFFLAGGFFLLHVPCYATQKWFDLYPEDIQLPEIRRDDRDAERSRRGRPNCSTSIPPSSSWPA